jgi:hypothetical protein
MSFKHKNTRDGLHGFSLANKMGFGVRGWFFSRRKGSGFLKEGMCNDFHSRHSLSAGDPPSALLATVGSPSTRFARRSLVPPVPINCNFFQKKYCRETGSSPILQSRGSIKFSTKGVSDCLALNQGFKNKLDYLSCFFTA